MGARQSVQPRQEEGQAEPGAAGQQLCVIIPALNEESNIGAAISSARAGFHGHAAPEVIVVDGGSTDGTVQVARKAGCKVLHTGKGRGLQLNAGWQATRRPWCLFLHADSQLPSSYLQALGPVITSSRAAPSGPGFHNLSHHQQQQQQQQQRQQAVMCLGKWLQQVVSAWGQPHHTQHPAVQWGCFKTIHTEWSNTLQGRILSGGVELRTRLMGQPYGDQALWAQREVLEQVGGLPSWPLLEDVELVRRLKRSAANARPHVLPLAVTTSGRRWDALGFWQTALLNQAVLLGWAVGVSPHVLAQWYYAARRGRQQQ